MATVVAIDDLSDDVLANVFCFLPSVDLRLGASTTCTRWLRVVRASLPPSLFLAVGTADFAHLSAVTPLRLRFPTIDALWLKMTVKVSSAPSSRLIC
jgi:hypothetical protein